MASKNLTTRINLKKKKDEEDILPIKKTTKNTEIAPVKQTTSPLTPNSNTSTKIVAPFKINTKEAEKVENKPVKVYSLDNGNVKTTTVKTKATKEAEKIDNKKQSTNNIISQSKAFQDGYDFGDVTKTILGTTVDIAGNFAKGELQRAEGIVDAGRYLVADVADKLGATNYASNVRQRAMQNTTGFILGQNDIYNNQKDNGWLSKTNDYSILGSKLDSIIESIGQQAFNFGFGSLTGNNAIVNNLEIFAGSYGTAKSEALNNGLSDEDATIRAVISGVAETISENLDNAIPGFKTGGITSTYKDLIGKSVEKALGSELAGKTIVRLLGGLGESAEERLSNALETIGTDIVNYVKPTYTYGMDENQGINPNDKYINRLGKLFKDALGSAFNPEANEAASTAFWSTLITGGIADTLPAVQRNQVINTWSEENNVSKETAKKLFDGIRDNRVNEITTEKTSYGDQIELKNQVTQQLANQIKNNSKLDLNELLNATQNQNQIIDNSVNQQVQEIEQNENRTLNNKEIADIRENTINSKQSFQLNENESRKLTDNDIELANSLSNSGFNNTEKSHNLYNVAKSLQNNNKSAKIRFISNENLAEMGINIDTTQKTVNGFKKGDTIYININGRNVFKTTIGHEIGEAIKSADNNSYTELKNLVKQVFGEQDLTSYQESYTAEDGTMLTDNVEDEWVNDKLGELFENENLRNRIADNRTLLQKVIDNIKSIVNKVTGKDQQKLKTLQQQLEDKFVELYKNTDFSNSKGDIALSLIDVNKANLNENQQNRVKLANEYKQMGLNPNTIWLKTGVNINKNSIYVNDIKPKSNIKISQLIENKTYNISDVFEGELLNNYPELKNKKLKILNFVEDAKSEGITNLNSLKALESVYGGVSDTGDLYINSLTKDKIDLEDIVNSHEFQHMIQYIEGRQTETNYIDDNLSQNDIDNKRKYRNSDDEIEAEINRVFGKMNKTQKHKIPYDYVEKAVNDYYKNNIKALNPEKIIKQIESKMWYDNTGDINVERTENIVEREEINRQTNNDSSSSSILESRKAETLDKLYKSNEKYYTKNDNEKNRRNINDRDVDNTSFSLSNLPKVKEGYTRLYRGLNGEYDPNYDKSLLDSPNGYDTLTDSYELAKQYGKNVYYIDIPTNQIANSVIDENPNSETYGDRNLAYKDNKKAGLNGVSGNEYLLYTDHDNFNSEDYKKVEENSISNPTKEDIKYSLTKNESNEFQDTMNKNENYFNAQEDSNNIDNAFVKRTTNKVSDDLQLNKNQTKELQSIVEQAITEELSPNEIEDLLNKFALQTYSEVNTDIIDQKRIIRQIPLKVSDAIKMDIADYNDFRRKHMGKLNISNSGISVDTAYQSLVEDGVVPGNITNPTDQLLKLAEIVDQASEMEQTYEIPLEKLQEEANYIYNNIIDNMFNTQTSGQAQLREQIARNDVPEIAPVRYMPESSVNNYIENRDLTPIRQDDLNKKTREEKKQQLATAKSWGLRAFVNQNAVTDSLADKTGNRALKYATDMYNSSSSEAKSNITGNQTNNNGISIGKGVNEIFAPSKESGLYEAFNDYLIQKSNIERTNVGKGSEIPIEVSQSLVKQYEKENPIFTKWAKDVYKYFDNVLQNEVEAGLVTKEQYDLFRGENGIYRSYVPFYPGNTDTTRYFDANGKIRPISTLKRSKGGIDRILSIEDSMIRQTYAYKNAIRENQRNIEIIQTLSDGKNDSIGIDLRQDNITDMNKALYKGEDGTNILAAYVDGKQITADISEELFNELARNSDNNLANIEDSLSPILNPIQKASRIRRNLLTTWNPTFIVTNALKDIQDASFNSKHTRDMLKNYPNSFKELIKQTDLAKQFMSLYGSENLYGDYDGTTKSKLINKIKGANEIVELAPRFAEFKATLENGGTIEEAMYNAREITTNFGRGGYITKALNRNGFTFLNANVQGLDKLIRNFKGENGVKGQVKVIAKATLFGIAPAILNSLIFGGDDDKDEDYEALPDYVKDNYYLIKLNSSDETKIDSTGIVIQVGTSKFLRIPKGRVLSVFGSAARRITDFDIGEDNVIDELKDWGTNAWSQIGIGDLGSNNLIAPLRQAQKNEAWYGGDIVPTRLQDMPVAEQTDASIDKISNFIGETFNISPYKVNYVLDQYTGGIGDILLPILTDETTNGASGLGYITAPIKDKFIVNSTDDNKYAGKFYELKDDLEKLSNSKYASDDDKLKYKYINSISQSMSELYKEKREIQADNTLTNQEKYEKVQIIQNEINSLSKEAVQNYKNGVTTENYSNYNDNEYYKNNDNEWTKVNESDAEFISGMTNEEKNTYFKIKNDISNVNNEYAKNIKGLNSKNDKDKGIINQYSKIKKKKIYDAISNSNLDDYTKGQCYEKYYLTEEGMANAINSGFTFENYVNSINNIDNIRDKYSIAKGYSTAQRKQQVVSYVNSLNLSVPQKAMLIKKYYSSFDDYNVQIINYVENLDISFDEKLAILKEYGMKVDNNNNVTW